MKKNKLTKDLNKINNNKKIRVKFDVTNKTLETLYYFRENGYKNQGEENKKKKEKWALTLLHHQHVSNHLDEMSIGE